MIVGVSFVYFYNGKTKQAIAINKNLTNRKPIEKTIYEIQTHAN